MAGYDPFDIASQEASANRRKDSEDRDRRQFSDDLKWLMSGPRGRRIVNRILVWCGIWRTSFTGNSETFFREGMRNIGLMLLGPISDTCPDQLALMMEEAKENERSNSTANDGSAGSD